jgi:aryl-alcohol dehydrogenase-like predicted oxidoreductase
MIPQVTLGSTGIRVSRLCIGTGTNGWGGSSKQTRLGFDRLVDLLEARPESRRRLSKKPRGRLPS